MGSYCQSEVIEWVVFINIGYLKLKQNSFRRFNSHSNMPDMLGRFRRNELINGELSTLKIIRFVASTKVGRNETVFRQ